MRRVAFLATVTIIGMTLAAAPNEAQQARYHIRPIELTGNLHVLTSDPAEEGRRTGGNTHTHYDHSGSNPEFADTVNFVAHENTAAHLASTDCDDGMGYEGGSIKNCERFQGENMFARKGLPFIDAANSNGSATEFVSSYSVSDRYRDFEAPANSLDTIVQLVLEGR